MPPDPGLADATLRQVVHVSLGGKRLRVRFSNAFGTKSLTILSARVAASAGGGDIEPRTADKPLTFGGRTSVTIPTGAPIVSDPIDFDLAPLSDLAVTIRVKDPTRAITGHPGCPMHVLSPGRRPGNGRPTCPDAARTPHWYYLCGVDVEAADAAAVAVLGDSITDGRGSPDRRQRPMDGPPRPPLARGERARPRRRAEPGARRQPHADRRPGAERPGAARSRRPRAARRALADRAGGDQRPRDTLGVRPAT